MGDRDREWMAHMERQRFSLQRWLTVALFVVVYSVWALWCSR